MTFEPDTGLLVNTVTGVVHKPGCEVVTRTTGRSGPWLAPWRGVAISDTDKPCGYCRPLAALGRTVAAYLTELHGDESATFYEIQWRADPAVAWVRWATGETPEATKAALAEFREAKPSCEWRAVRVRHSHTLEDW